MRAACSLDEIARLIDWRPIGALLEPLYPAAKGEPAWPPLAMFRSLLLSAWYDLSDVKLAETLDDRASFWRFCGFSNSEPTPERIAFVRYRRRLVAHGLGRALFEAVTAQLKAKAIRVKTGTLVGATVVASASEAEGRWVKHKSRPATHGFKARVDADASTALVEKVAVTPAHVNDGRAGPQALPDALGEVFADSACRDSHFGDAVRAKGGVPRVVAAGMWGRDEAEVRAKLTARNQPIQHVRGRIETIFGTWKRSSGLRRMRRRGLVRATVQVHLTAIAYNLKRSLAILAAARTPSRGRMPIVISANRP